MTSKFPYKTTNYPSANLLAEMELWQPPQGTIRQMVPIQVDLLFDCEKVETSTSVIEVYARRATLHLSLKNASVVRGSKLGDIVHAPYVIAEVTRSAREILESSAELGLKGEIAIETSFWGKIGITHFFKKSKTVKKEDDSLLKASSKRYRVAPRTGDRWLIVEPIAPNVLSGKYIGETIEVDGQEKSAPLCFLNMEHELASAELVVSICSRDLDIRTVSKQQTKQLHKNKEIVIAHLLRMSLDKSVKMDSGVTLAWEGDTMLLNRSKLEVENASIT